MPTLPAGFIPITASYQGDEPGGVVRTDVAGGAPRYAMDWDRGTQRYHVTLILNDNQFALWTLFYAWQIGKGSVAFSMTIDSGLGPNPHMVNIMPGSYNAMRTDGNISSVTFVAETEADVYAITAAQAQAMFDAYSTYGNNSKRFFDRLAKFANSDTLVLQ